MGSYHKIDEISIKNGVLYLVVDGQEIKKSLSEISPLLASANDIETENFEISHSGYEIHWPLLDEDKLLSLNFSVYVNSSTSGRYTCPA